MCFDDVLFAARSVTKVASSGVGALRAAEGPVGRLDGSAVRFARGPGRRALHGPRVVLDVPMFSVYPGMGGDAIEATVASGAPGLVVEGTGLGNVPPGVAAALGGILAEGIPVVIARRPREGEAAATYGGEGGGGTLAAMGAVPGRELPAHKARIALMIALGVDPTIAGVQRWFRDL